MELSDIHIGEQFQLAVGRVALPLGLAECHKSMDDVSSGITIAIRSRNASW